MHSPEVWEQPWVPLPEENALLREPPLQLQALTFGLRIGSLWEL